MALRGGALNGCGPVGVPVRGVATLDTVGGIWTGPRVGLVLPGLAAALPGRGVETVGRGVPEDDCRANVVVIGVAERGNDEIAGVGMGA